ncbi:hypothetical protein GGR54DRAFT_361208 [Hypoxylon sp. NC1633]|nr:hypothetical protein GGR54DRAFT_361208 [Hypoxylon sp. NC1633]
MHFFSNIRKDFALRNATIYGQWFLVLGAISCVLMRLSWIIEFGLSQKIPSLVRFIDMILFPIYALSMENQPTTRWRWVLVVALVWCFGRTFVDWAIVTQGPEPFRLIISALREVATFPFFLIPLRQTDSSEYPVRQRACFYIAYTVVFVWGARGRAFFLNLHCDSFPLDVRCGNVFGVPDSALWPAALHFEPAEVFFGLAAAAYVLALWLGHGYMYSRTLGGPGVEMMSLILPGQAAEEDFVGHGERRIMLP